MSILGGAVRRVALWAAVGVPAFLLFAAVRGGGRDLAVLFPGTPVPVLTLRELQTATGQLTVLAVSSDSGFTLEGSGRKQLAGKLGRVRLAVELARLRRLGVCNPPARPPVIPGGPGSGWTLRLTSPGMDCSLEVPPSGDRWWSHVHGRLADLMAQARADAAPARP